MISLHRSIGDLEWNEDVAAPFYRFAGQDLRTWPVIANLLWNWLVPSLRARQLERRYYKQLSNLLLAELPEKPDFVFCATDMVFGVNFIFGRHWSGDYRVGYATELSKWPLARAVAASSCFPPVFGPLRLRVAPSAFKGGKYHGTDRSKLLRSLALTDGGVYDNMGLEPVWKTHEYVLVSDCGAPFDFRPSNSFVRRILRYTSVVSNQAAAVRKRVFFNDLRGATYRGTYWGIAGTTQLYGSEPAPSAGYSGSLVSEVIARIRTDLDKFLTAEKCVLENHGYLLADAAVRRRVPDLVTKSVALTIPHPEWMDEVLVRQALSASARRVSLKRLLPWVT